MVVIPSHDWVAQEWLLEEVLECLGAEEMLHRSCNVCRAWREWCNRCIRVLQIGNDYQRVRSTGLEGTITSRALEPLFLPLVPLNLLELNLSGTWTALQPDELGIIRRGCRLRKLTMTGMRLYSFSYRELLLFKYLEELDISNSHLDVPLPFLLFDEPAGESVYAYAEAEEGVGSTTATATNSDTRCSEQDEHYQRQQQQAHENGGHVESTNNTPASKPGVRPSLTAGTSRVLPNSKRSATQPPLGYRPPPAAAAAAAAADGEWGEIVRTRDSPRFALTLRKLTAVKTTLWKRWDLSNFGPLRSLEVSFAGRRTVEQLARKARTGSGLTALSVCDVSLCDLVRATELHELAQALGCTATFRLRRVDVVKDLAQFAYLRAVLARLGSLQELELTDVTLSDAMLAALGECLLMERSAVDNKRESVSRTPPPPPPSPPVYGFPTGLSPPRYPPPAPRRQGTSSQGTSGARGADRRSYGSNGMSPDESSREHENGRGEIATLRTLTLGCCEGISASALENFLALNGAEGDDSGRGGDGSSGRDIGEGEKATERRGNGWPATLGGGGGGRTVTSQRNVLMGGAPSTGVSRASSSIALSTVQLRGCRALQDRALKLLAVRARGRLKNIQVTGSLQLTDNGVEALATACPRLEHVDISGCPNVTSNTLIILLAKCPVLRCVKAWGVRAVCNALGGSLGAGNGSMVGEASAAGGMGRREASGVGAAFAQKGARTATSSTSVGASFQLSLSTTSEAVRAAYAGRGVDLSWTEPLPLPIVGVIPELAMIERAVANATEDEARDGSHDAEDAKSSGRRGTGRVATGASTGVGDSRACHFQCGAVPKMEDALDHIEVCPLARVPCLLQADGCSWIGMRQQRQGHLQTCPVWQVKCPVCCQGMHPKDFTTHMLAHSLASEASALRPPGCALRAYGCRACRATTNAPLTATVVASGASDGGNGEGDGKHVRASLVHDDTAIAEGGRDHTAARCPLYRTECKSCQKEVGRDEWDKGLHKCLVRRRIDVLVRHAPGAGMLRNRQWLQIVYGYMGGVAEGEDDPRNGAFHGVNPMCAMPHVLSATLPLPGPAGAPASPVATSPG